MTKIQIMKEIQIVQVKSLNEDGVDGYNGEEVKNYEDNEYDEAGEYNNGANVDMSTGRGERPPEFVLMENQEF